MRCVGHTRNKLWFQGLIAGLVLMVVSIGSDVPSARAVDTQINVEVCSGTSLASLVLTAPAPASVHALSPVHTTGNISRVSQITVYVDGQFNATIPINSGATSFTYDVSISPGTHTIKYVGMDLCQMVSPVAEIEITFEPSSVTEPVTGPDPPAQPAPSAQTGLQVGGTIQPISFFSNAIYSVLIALDFATITSFDSVWIMVQRFLIFLIGLILLLLPHLVLMIYRILRYRVFKLRKRPLPEFLRARPIVWIRLIGLVLLLSLFVLMT